MKNVLLNASRFLLIIGIVGIAGAIFLNGYYDIMLSTANAKLENYQNIINDKYYIEKPIAPVDYSDYMVPPKYPEKGSSKEDFEEYNERKKEFSKEKENVKAEYNKAMKKYYKDLSEYEYNLKKMEYKKKKDEYSMKKMRRSLIRNASKSKYSKNFKLIPYIVKFAGILLLLFGALGILLLADVYEKLGVLILVGFGFKFIFGI